MKSLFIVFVIVMFLCASAAAQTTSFTYQGSLKDGASQANGNYDFEFKLFDLVSGGAEHGSTIHRLNVAVANGIFTVSLDFGAGTLPGADRFLDIAVRTAGGGAFTPLSPRPRVNSAPYSVRSLNSTTADLATNATQLGGVAAGQYVVTTDPRMTDARPPTAGSADYIQSNPAAQQPATSLNIGGNATVGGTLAANIVRATTQFNIGGVRVLSIAGSSNLFAGSFAGSANTTGSGNAFVGSAAGAFNTTGQLNAFFGTDAGFNNITGGANAFIGYAAGYHNTAGNNNSFIGPGAGYNNTSGNDNTFVGNSAGSSNTTGNDNSFVGFQAGGNNTTGTLNAFFGNDAGLSNDTGSYNSFFGHASGTANTTGIFNAFFGKDSGVSNTTGDRNAFVGTIAGRSNTTGSRNSFFGTDAGFSNTTADVNAYFGFEAGKNNTTGAGNAFFGTYAGRDNTAPNNAFFGTFAGVLNTSGGANAFFGRGAGQANTTSSGNAYFGYQAGVNSTGQSNSFFGNNAGAGNTSGPNNTFIGIFAGNTNTIGGNNTAVGMFADVAANNLNFATAIGSGTVVSTSNSVVLGRSAGQDTVRVPGNLNVTGSITGSFTVPAANITGVVARANGGTGLSGSGAAGNVLRSDGSNWASSAIQASDFPGGNGNYIQNSNTPQAANFNILGNGTIDGSFLVNKDGVLAANNGQIKVMDPDNLSRGLILGHEQTTTSVISFIQTAPDGVGNYPLLAVQANGGNVGIGTTAPEQKLHVDGNSEIFSSGSGAGFKFRNRGSTSFTDDWVWYSQGNLARFFRAGTGDLITVTTSGIVAINALGAAGGTSLCRNASNEISTCSSSLRYKTNISKFSQGMSFVGQLRPISFDWKQGEMKDVGFGAEDVAKIDPRFVTYNEKGEVEGVKYDRLSVAFVNAFKEQQEQIEAQQKEIVEQKVIAAKQQALIEQLVKRLEQLEKKENK